MAVVEVPRPLRAPPGMPAVDELRLAPPPSVAPAERGGLGQLLLGGAGSLGMIGFALTGRNVVFLALAVVLAVATVGGSFATRLGQRRSAARRSTAQAARWRTLLDGQVARARAAAAAQRGALEHVHPSMAGLAARARGGHGLWERRPADPDAWSVRVGVGPVPALVTLAGDALDAPLADTDPALSAEASAAVAAAGVLPAAPVVVDLAAARVLGVIGPVDGARAAVRAIVAELACARPPGELTLRLVTSDVEAWQWLVWLPHRVLLADQPGTGGPELVIADGCAAAVPDGGALLRLAAAPGELPAETGALLSLVGRPRLMVGGVVSALDRPAALDASGAEELARALAPLRPAGRAGGRRRADGTARGEDDVRLLDLGEVEHPHGWDARAGWGSRPAAERLRVPLGVGDDGEVVWLDLRESAEGGHGPHGLVVGATGSGKSEVLRSLVAGLALRHSPSELAMVLVDWKGGAAFDDVSALPHVAGLVTNLADEPGLVDRVGHALTGELERRQLVLRAARADSLRSYDARRAAGEPLPPVPALLVVIDEFGELLAAQPELLDVLGRVGRLGRSLGVHLVLSSQRLEEGRLRGLDAHLRFRLCLRVFTAAESAAVLGAPDAAHLPTRPGAGVLAVDGRRVRLQAAHSGAPCPQGPATRVVPLVRPLRLGEVVDVQERGDGPTERAVAVGRILAAGATPVAPVWLAPLPSHVALVPGGLTLGLADVPLRQAQPAWALDLTRDGHVLVAGAPGAGVSTLLRAVAAAACSEYPPSEVQLALLDFGGGGLASLDALPHTRCLAGPAEPDLALALVRSLRALVATRTARARALGLDGAGAWWAARSAGRLDGDAAEVLVLLDGLGRAREELPTLDDDLAALAASGLRVGVRLVVATQRWAEVRPALRELIAMRIELRLTDPLDSLLPRGVAAGLVGAPPGRGLTGAGVLVQVGDPAAVLADLAVAATVQGAEVAAEAGAGAPPPVAPVAPEVAEAALPALPAPRWAPVPRLLRLPERVETHAPGVLGVREGDRAEVAWDGRGLLVLGDRGSGRTTLLRRLLRVASADPTRRVLVVDPRRSLLEASGGTRVTWTSGGGDTAAAVGALAAELAARLPSSAVGRAQLLGGRWWDGPEHLLVVDDGDLLPSGSLGGVLSPLVDPARRGTDIGFACVFARPVAGLARAAFDPFLTALRESGGAGLLLSGDPAEGPALGGVRATRGRLPGRATWVAHDRPPIDLQLAVDGEALAEVTPITRRSAA